MAAERRQEEGLGQKVVSSLQRIESTLSKLELNSRSPHSEVWHPYRENPQQVCCSVRCIVITVGDIDTVKQEFDAEIYLSLRWKEERYNGMEAEDIDWTQCWDPRVYFSNAVTISKLERKHRLVQDRGETAVLLSIRMRATFKTEMRLRNFPMDYQELKIKLMSNWPEEVVKFEKDMQWPDNIRTDTFTGQHEWILHSHLKAEPDIEEENVRHKRYPKYNISIHVERKIWYYMWNIALVVLLILLLNFTCLSLEASAPESRLGVTLTLLLTAVTFKFVVSSRLPTISYLTLLDAYVLLSLICQCLFVAQNAIAVVFDHHNLSEQWDHISFSILGLLAVVLNFAFMIAGFVMKKMSKKKMEDFTNTYNDLCDEIELRTRDAAE